MGILQAPAVLPGQVGVIGAMKYMVTTDSLATITTAGYLNQVDLAVNPISPNDVLGITYSYNTVTNSGTFEIFTVSISAGVISVVQWANPGDVLLPVTSNHIAVFNGTTGQIKSDTATAINGGNLQAGLSGTAGTLASFPGTAANGSLIVKAINNTGAFNTTLSNSNIGQSTVYSLPDGGVATTNVLITDSAGTQTINTGSLALALGSVTATQGSFTAGSSGHAGTFTSFPGTASNGTLVLAAANAGGAFNTTISNATSVGQSQVISIPDSGATTANFIVSKSAADQHITVSGLQADAGALTSGISTGGFVGLVKAFPTTASKGFIAIQGAVNATGNFGTTISNALAQAQATVVTIPDPGAATSNFVLSQSTLATNNVAFTRVLTLGFAALATAGKINIAAHPSGTSQFAILDIKVLNSTGLSGGGGNRLLAVSDGTIVFNNAGITAALLGTPVFTLWGGTGNPVAVGTSQVSTAGADIFFQYTGGATDYTAGSVQIAVTLVQVTA